MAGIISGPTPARCRGRSRGRPCRAGVACSAGTSGDSPSCRSTSISRRIARIRSPSWPPKDSSTMAAQSSSPEAHRNTEGMKPVEMPVGMERWPLPLRGLDALGDGAHLVEPVPELGTLLQEGARDRAIARARLLDQRRAEGRRLGERRVLRGGHGRSISATSSSLSCRRPAMSWPLARSLPSCTAPKCSRMSTTFRNSCQ